MIYVMYFNNKIIFKVKNLKPEFRRIRVLVKSKLSHRPWQRCWADGIYHFPDY
jgi:hypothetical protein